MMILVVEDKVAAILGKVLQNSGHTVELAESGETALEIIHRTQIDFFPYRLDAAGDDGAGSGCAYP